MKRRLPTFKPRRPVFVAVEGKSEQAFVKFLQHLCDEHGRSLSLICAKGSGGDTVTIVREAHRSLKRRRGRIQFKDRLVLLDQDRVDADLQAGLDAKAIASELGFEIIYQTPDLEGLLIRFHPGSEQKSVARGTEGERLRRLWREYSKPPTAHQLIRKFELDDLRRAARYDEELKRLLDVIGL